MSSRAKAAPGYWLAKQIIKLIHNVGRVINNDARASRWMKAAFIPDYRVSLAEQIIPAADLSEQISAAGTEASGTGTMKFAMNGAVTIGTPDGAKYRDSGGSRGREHFYFGAEGRRCAGHAARRSYRPRGYYDRDNSVWRVVDAFRSNLFCPQEPDLFAWIYQTVLDENDAYFHLADLPAYLEAHKKTEAVFQNHARWTRWPS